MMQLKDNKEKKEYLKPVMIIGLVIGVVAIVLLAVVLARIFRTNPYGSEIRIDNISDSFSDLPQNQKDLIFSNLYNMVLKNVPEGTEIPTSGALVRDDTSVYEYDKETQVYHGKFVVDIPVIKQSYQTQFVWSLIQNNPNLGGYDVVITCLPRNLQIYEDFYCENAVEANSFWQNAYQLDYTVGAGTSTRIRNTIGNYLMSVLPEENGYTISIDETSLKREKNEIDLVYSFRIDLNQKFGFNVFVKMDEMYGERYVVIYVKGDGAEKGFVLSDAEDLIGSLVAWLGAISQNNELTVDIEPLSYEGV